MNYIKHLTGFFDRIVKDSDLNPTHISLYIGLFQHWNVNRFQNPISITRDEVMRISKIASKATYHKCMKDLHNKGYVKYEPSYNPFKGSMVILYNLAEDLKPVQKTASAQQKIGSITKQALNKYQTGDQTSTEQALVPSINNTNNLNNTNNSNLGEHAKYQNEDENLGLDENISKKEKGCAEKEKTIAPNLEEIKTYFSEKSFPELEAQKFFNHFSSNGWLVGGKSPMVDWRAAAKNWMINASKFATEVSVPDRTKNLNVQTDKDYSEPL